MNTRQTFPLRAAHRPLTMKTRKSVQKWKILNEKIQRELKRTSDRLTRSESQDMLAVLASHYNMLTPTLRWSWRTTRGRANGQSRVITAGPRVWRGTTNCLIHEFSHLLNYKRNGDSGHGKNFIAVLHEVATLWHGDADAYGWATEYKSVASSGPSEPKGENK